MSFQESFRVERVRYEMSWLHVAVCCSVLQCAAVCEGTKILSKDGSLRNVLTVFCSVLQCVAECCSVCRRENALKTRRFATIVLDVCCGDSGCMFCSVFQCVSVCYSVL